MHMAPGSQGIGDAIRERADKDYDIPGTLRRRVAAETIRTWLKAYRRDGFEALVPKRKSDSSTVMQRVVPQILQELEGFDRKGDRALLFVGATNRPWMLDEAMLRPGRLRIARHRRTAG